MSAFQGGMNPMMGGMNPGMNPMMGGMNPNMNPMMQGNQNQGPPPLKYKLFSPNAKAPFKTYASDAGFDLAALEDGSIQAGEIAKKINTGVGFELPTGLFGLVRDRSSLASQGLMVAGGVIDSDYRGEIIVMLHNLGKEPFNYRAGDRIAQVIILPSGFFTFVEAGTLDNTARAAGGFGSTGMATPTTSPTTPK
jgi:dUTP pyrophosphatase